MLVLVCVQYMPCISNAPVCRYFTLLKAQYNQICIENGPVPQTPYCACLPTIYNLCRLGTTRTEQSAH